MRAVVRLGFRSNEGFLHHLGFQDKWITMLLFTGSTSKNVKPGANPPYVKPE